MHGLEHPALVYASVAEFLGYMVPFVAGGIDRGEPVLAALGADELAALRREFGPDSDAMVLADTRAWHPHTGRRLRAFHDVVAERLAAGSERVRLVGEPAWPSGFPELEREWTRYESALNAILAPFPVTLVCTYPAARLDPTVVATARRTHPMITGRVDRASGDFEEPTDLLRRLAPELPPPPHAAEGIHAPDDLAAARRFVWRAAVRAGLDPDRASDLLIAVNEVLTNSMIHGDGAVALLAWTERGRFVCQIADVGSGIEDPLAGYHPPADAATSGRGLWIARQLVDLLQVAPGAPGTTVRLHMRIARAA